MLGKRRTKTAKKDTAALLEMKTLLSLNPPLELMRFSTYNMDYFLRFNFSTSV